MAILMGFTRHQICPDTVHTEPWRENHVKYKTNKATLANT